MAAKRTKAKKITLSEFKTWLAGVQSMQPKDWHPSKENWDMILEQIANITETVVEKKVIVQQQQPDRNVPIPEAHYDNPAFDPHNPANADMLGARRPAPAQTQVPPSAIPLGRPAPTIKMGKPTGDHGALAVEIKDGDGEYESSFS